MVEIKAITDDTSALLFTMDDKRLDSERVRVTLEGSAFALSYQPLPGALWRMGQSPAAVGAYTVGFLAWLDGQIAGQILLASAAFGIAQVLDLRVGLHARRHGVASALLVMAEDWARQNGFTGVSVETQDVNAAACQFLSSQHYALGGVDRLRYAGASRQTILAKGLRETALIFYKFLR